MKNLYIVLSAVVLFALASCGGESKGGVKLSDKGKLLTSKSWKLDPNATLKGTTDNIKDSTGITADIQLKGDVGKIAGFLAETVTFGPDQNDKTKLAYSRKIGEGLLSSSVTGYWEFNPDETAIIMKEWDSYAGKEKAPVIYKIVELTDKKLVLQKEGDSSPNIYFAK
jgi:hypothetical protein